MGVVIDIAALANFPEAEERTVKYIGKAFGLQNRIADHVWTSRAWDLQDTIPIDNIFSGFMFTSDAPGRYGVVTNGDESKFFYGDCTLILATTGTLPDIYDISIDIDVPGAENIPLYLSTNVLNSLVSRQVVTLTLPNIPLHQVNVRPQLFGAASSLNLYVATMWNGLFFNNH